MIHRPRRLRTNQSLRDLVEETQLSAKDFIAPLFVMDGKDQAVAVKSMPGIFRYSLDLLLKEVEELSQLGVRGVCLFPALEDQLKDSRASEALNEKGLYLRCLREVAERFPQLVLMTDVALDPYSSDGHDGLVDPKSGEILNDATLEILAQMAVAQAKAGATMIGPSDMMDGRVGVIRAALDAANFSNVSIMSYTAKYASAFYGPFRDALESAPKKGDKKSYQMNPANRREALREAQLDAAEGADILMVKPALSYLDIISDLKRSTTLPISAYNVSGEYAMVKAAAQNGWIDGDKVMLEILLSIKRAGADIILTYFAKDAAKLL